MPGCFNSPEVCVCLCVFLVYFYAIWFLWWKKKKKKKFALCVVYAFLFMHVSVTAFVLLSLKMCFNLCFRKNERTNTCMTYFSICALNSMCTISDTILLLFHEVIFAIQTTTKTGCKGHSVSVVVTRPSHKRGQKFSIHGSVGWRGAMLVCATVLKQGLGRLPGCDSMFSVEFPSALCHFP